MTALLNIRIICTRFFFFKPEYNEGSLVLNVHFSYIWKLMQLLDKLICTAITGSGIVDRDHSPLLKCKMEFIREEDLGKCSLWCYEKSRERGSAILKTQQLWIVLSCAKRRIFF